MTGRFVWHELMVSDPKAAIAFYSEVIGWKTEAFGPPKDGDQYNMWVGGQGPLGGVMKLPAEAKAMGVPPHWMGHVEVADVDETVAQVKSLGGSAVDRAKRLGGKTMFGPMKVPDGSRIAQLSDPQGTWFALHEAKKND